MFLLIGRFAALHMMMQCAYFSTVGTFLEMSITTTLTLPFCVFKQSYFPKVKEHFRNFPEYSSETTAFIG